MRSRPKAGCDLRSHVPIIRTHRTSLLEDSAKPRRIGSRQLAISAGRIYQAHRRRALTAWRTGNRVKLRVRSVECGSEFTAHSCSVRRYHSNNNDALVSAFQTLTIRAMGVAALFTPLSCDSLARGVMTRLHRLTIWK